MPPRVPRRAGPRARPHIRPRVEPLEGRAVPAMLTVTTAADSGPGSLRAAITQADADHTDDTIDFAPSVTGAITLLSALPDLSAAMTIAGPGASALTVARGAAAGTPAFRIFAVDAGADVAISGLTLTGGLVLGAGGGILNSGTLTVTASTIVGNSSQGDPVGGAGTGGGISNAGTLTIADCTFRGNTAQGAGPGATGTGGGISNAGTLTIADSTFSGNSAGGGFGFQAGGAGTGGGISNAGTLTIADCQFSGNSASGGGGGNGTGSGGGISNANAGTLMVTGSTFSGNSANFGGGIENLGSLTVTDSTFSGNSVTGPAVFFVPSNSRGGGISNAGTLTVTDSTFSGNSASGGLFGAGSGGGISNAGTLMVADSTFSGNAAVGGAGPGGTGGVGSGGGVSNAGPGTATLLASIFSNAAGGNLANQAGTVTSRGHNLLSDAPAVPLDSTDLINADPLLAPLANYGGPSPTMALLPGSPAIDAGVAVPGVATDQRGVARPQGAAPDIGAFESRGFTLAVAQGSGQAAVIGAPFALPLVVAVASPFGEPVSGGLVRFAAPPSGASAALAADVALVDAQGLAGVAATANGVAGAYGVVAQAAGAGPVIFDLANALPAIALATPSGAATVVGLRRLGVHWQPTRIVLSFGAALDPARARDPANYRLVALGPGGRPIRPVGLTAPVYDPSGPTVTLRPRRRLSLRRPYQLTVIGSPPSGLASPGGTFLAGAGVPGTDYTATLLGFAAVDPKRPASTSASRPNRSLAEPAAGAADRPSRAGR